MEEGLRRASTTAGFLIFLSIFLPWWIDLSKIGDRVALDFVGLFAFEGSNEYLALKMSSFIPNSHPMLSLFFLAMLLSSMLLMFAGGKMKTTVACTLIFVLLGINFLYFLLDALTYTTQSIRPASSVSIPFFGFVVALIGGIIGRRSLHTEVFEASRQRWSSDGLPPSPPVKPSPTESVESEARKPVVKDITPTVPHLALDDRVYGYIVNHNGTISLSRATVDLGVTLRELNSSIGRLKKIGKLG